MFDRLIYISPPINSYMDKQTKQFYNSFKEMSDQILSTGLYNTVENIDLTIRTIKEIREGFKFVESINTETQKYIDNITYIHLNNLEERKKALKEGLL